MAPSPKRREARARLSRLSESRRHVPANDLIGQQLLELRTVRAWQTFFWTEALRETDTVDRYLGIQPSCATEAGYQWHRYHRDVPWPLSKADPCGCRAAHTTYERERRQEKREAAEEVRHAS